MCRTGYFALLCSTLSAVIQTSKCWSTKYAEAKPGQLMEEAKLV